MIVSLNQIEQTARKAARGAGLPWGLADDVGRSVRWLQLHQLDGVSALAALLRRQDHRRYGHFSPRSLSGVWCAPGGELSPLLAGASLGDCLERLSESPVETGAIAYPVLAVGFVGGLLADEERSFRFSWSNVAVVCSAAGVRVEGEARSLGVEAVARLGCCLSILGGNYCAFATGGMEIAPSAWDRLEGFAQRTYVEATETSRRAGAGAGLRDND